MIGKERRRTLETWHLNVINGLMAVMREVTVPYQVESYECDQGYACVLLRMITFHFCGIFQGLSVDGFHR